MKVWQLLESLKRFDPEMDVALAGYVTPFTCVGEIRSVSIIEYAQFEQPFSNRLIWGQIGGDTKDLPKKDFVIIQ